MAYELRLPDIGEGLREAEVVSWLAGPGDTVTANQPLVEVETDKAVVEIPSPRAGVLLHVGAAVGSVIEVGELLAVIGEPGETWTSPAAPAPAAAAPGPPPAPPRPGDAAVRAVPLVRRLAAELSVDLAMVTGTGASGQITRDDVRAAADRTAGSLPPGREPSKLRRTIAEHMSRSWAEIPHVTVWGPAQAAPLLEARRRSGHPLEALLVSALLPVLAELPDFSATFDGTTLRPVSPPEVGIAVDTEAGLLVPVLRKAAGTSRDELATEIDRLVAGARDRTLGPAELRGQSFTITNVGAVGGGYGTPIIPWGTTAILSVGRAQDEVLAQSGQAVVAPVFPLALSFDHRVIDGAAASRFLRRATEEIEQFG
jgi:pyruvate dehydrogenase E2 component (dihydrolipoamide acetyltransferase)